jgi:hypothetical protein
MKRFSAKLLDEYISKRLFNSKKVFATVIIAGLGLYLFVLLSFVAGSNWLPVRLHGNSALSEYATVIAGTVGTAVTILGVAFLIYAYQAQQRQSQNALFNKLYEDLLNDINSVQYRKTSGSSGSAELFQGVEALFQYEAKDDKVESSVLNHLNLILVSFKQLVALLDDKTNSVEEKGIFLQKIYLLYLAKIYWPGHKISHDYRHYIMLNNWGYHRMLFYHLDFMTAKSHRFLLEKGLLVVEPVGLLPDQLIKHPYQKTESDRLGKDLRSIMACDYTDIQTYWNAPPTITEGTLPVLQASAVNKAVVRLLGESPFSDVVLEKVNQGSILATREFLYWLRTAFTGPSRYPSKKQHKGPTDTLPRYW